jgi:hypothetical protein
VVPDVSKAPISLKMYGSLTDSAVSQADLNSKEEVMKHQPSRTGLVPVIKLKISTYNKVYEANDSSGMKGPTIVVVM